MDNLEFLDGAEAPNGEAAPTPQAEAPSEPATTEPVAEAPQEPEAEQKGPVRGPDGKFAKKEASEPVMVPLAALHETRDKVRDLEARLAAAIQPQVQQQPQVPDIFEDPAGYQAYQQQQLQSAIYLERRNISHRFAVQQFGEDAVAEAVQWGGQVCANDPQFNAALLSSPDPVGAVVVEYQRQRALSQIGTDPKQIEAYLAWQQAQQAAPQPGATPPPQQQRPTSSIASATSAGGVQHTATGPGVAFDNVIR